MRWGLTRGLGAGLVLGGVLVVGIGPGRPSRGDEPGLLGRLFRGAGGSSSRSNSTPSGATYAPPYASTLSSRPTATPTTPEPSTGGTPRLLPQPRVNQAVTEADPLLTRVSIGRSDDGHRFGMFLQVYSDGTVLSSEGVHHVSRKDLQHLVETLQASDPFRIRGHCGGPPTDFIEQVHITVFERSLGRLRANSFSFSGNLQGCDHTLRHLNAAIDALQAKLSGPPTMAPTAAGAGAAPATPAPSTPTAQPSGSRTVIPLTPLN